jgi:membrane-associated protease RseP (regulator of RpoE activity)
MIPAKKFGVRVTQYFVGFGPTVWSKTKGETEYGIKAIPLGGLREDRSGCCRPERDQRAGVHATRRQPAPSRPIPACLGPVGRSDAREAEWEHIRPEDEPRLFYKMSWWKRVVVMAGGPFVPTS